MRRSTRFVVVISLCFSAHLEIHAQSPKASIEPSPVHATIEHADITLSPTTFTIEVALSTPFLPQGVPLTNPDRLVFDFPGFTLPAGNKQMPINNGPIRRFRVALYQSEPPISRIVIDLKEPVNFDVKPEGNKLVIEIPFPQAVSVSPSSTLPAVSEQKKIERKKEEPRLDSKDDTPSKPVTPASHQASGESAYKLMDKAKQLKIDDLQNLEDKATGGDPEAETLLALALHSGTLLRRDDGEALRLLQKAADHGFVAAEESLGIFFAMGIGMDRADPTQALEWYKKAAAQGSLDAATDIALMYEGGAGIVKDPSQAMIWFRRAAEGGDATAQYNLALIYGRGKDVPQNYKESVRWLTAAADQNVVPAILNLATLYLHPADGTPADVQRAIQYYEKAAELGSVPAEVMLGNIFAEGTQGKADYEKAVTWYRKAADQGQADAQFELGLRYALGQGVPGNSEEALRLFIAAADQGQTGAQYYLATMYEEGKGTPADEALAEHYYQLSAERGVARAQFRLGRLLAGKKESRGDQVSAYKWLMLAADSVKESSPLLSDLRKSMSQEEINEAERQVDAWRTAHRENHDR